MSKFPEIALLTMALLLAACSSLPGPAPGDAATGAAQQPTPPQAEAPSDQPSMPPDTPDADTEAAADALVDYNQQFYEQAVAALKQGDTALALELLLAVSRDAPEKPFVFTNLGLAYFKLQQHEPALEAFRQAVSRNPRDAVAFNHLGILQRQQGEFEAARQSYQRALEIDSNYALAHLNLGILFDIYLQDLERALRHYQRYQALSGGKNEQVSGWIVDLERRLQPATS